jgi:uncharacterized protein (DUF2249 family)
VFHRTTPAPAAAERPPVLASWTIAEVLRRYPELLDELLRASPAFGHLRNPLVRRVQARLATVAHAARVAGLEPAELVRRLNEAAGLTPAVDAERVAAPDVDAGAHAAPGPDAPVAAEVDARPILARGEEPFAAIVAAAAGVPVGQALRLLVGFEPVPLYGVLAKQGFAPRARQLAPDRWEVLFVRQAGGQTRGAPPGAAAPPAPPRAAAPVEPTATLTIDVSELVPPEPMVRILETLAELPPGAVLLVHHVRRPIHLYPRLDELGCQHETRELAPNRVEILIRKPAA